MNFSTLLKQPSAFLPIAMSIAALATVLVHIGDSGVVPEADEGAAAHIFQLIVIAQVPLSPQWHPFSFSSFKGRALIGAFLAGAVPHFTW